MARNERGVYIAPDGNKTFVPLENNPDVFTDLVHRLGVSDGLRFYDVWSVDEPASLQHIPRPVYALIFIAPAEVYHRVRQVDDGTKNLAYDGCGDDEPVVWFKQTIGHACGLIALLHSVLNGPARAFLTQGSLLERLLKECIRLKPLERAKVLHDSEELEVAHMASAMKGDTIPPSSMEPNGYHFISFVKGKDGHLYELEGSVNGPIDRGAIDDAEDVLSERALNAGVRRFLRAAQGNAEFSMTALAT